MRIESQKPAKNGGWVHRLDGKDVHLDRCIPKPKPRPSAPDFFALMNKYKPQCTDELCKRLANQLGVTEDSLRRLEMGYDGTGCFTFPMRDASDKVIGIKLRANNGSKYCVPGSALGIYYPIDVSSASRDDLYITEGESDCAAMLSMGFSAIGRPSCSGGVEIIKQFLSTARRHVVIMADNDAPKPDTAPNAPGLRVARPGMDGAVTAGRSHIAAYAKREGGKTAAP